LADISTGRNANRTAWEFSYTASAVLAGAAKKKAFHQSRLKWWTEKKEAVKETIKAEGMDFEESLSDVVSNSYRQTGVNIRTDLLKDLNECNSRINVHRDKISGYDAWIEVLGSQGDAALALTQDDWLYFFSVPA